MDKVLKKPILFLALLAIAGTAGAQVKFRSGIFLHHSTGGCIWGQDGSTTTVPQEMASYNAGHGYHGEDSVRMDEAWFPGSADNEWSTWHTIYETDEPENVSDFFATNRIVMLKSCFPSSDLWGGVGQPSDTAAPADKTIFNYQWHWRHIIAVMRGHPDNFFVIWTNAPLATADTDSGTARLASRFCRWAKDTLAAGLDPAFGPLPANVYVFDFFHILADSVGFLPDAYSDGAGGGSHPNHLATDLAAPQLVNELFDAAIAYETAYNGVAGRHEPGTFSPLTILDNRPNPFARGTEISYQLPAAGRVKVRIYDVAGREVKILLDQYQRTGRHSVGWNGNDDNGRRVVSGVYLCRLETEAGVATRKLHLIK